MEFKKDVYERFYWIFQRIFITVEFPNGEWRRTCRNITSAQHWEIAREGTVRPLSVALSGKEWRYFNRFRTDYNFYDTDIQHMPDDIVIKTLNWLGAYLNRNFIYRNNLTDEIVAEVLFQLFWEQYEPSFLDENPEFLVFNSTMINSENWIEFEIKPRSPQHKISKDAESEMDVSQERIDKGKDVVRRRIEDCQSKAKANGDYLSIETFLNSIISDFDETNLSKYEIIERKRKIVAKEIIARYYKKLSNYEYNSAFEMWDFESRGDVWQHNPVLFSLQFLEIRKMVWDIEVLDVSFLTDCLARAMVVYVVSSYERVGYRVDSVVFNYRTESIVLVNEFVSRYMDPDEFARNHWFCW